MKTKKHFSKAVTILGYEFPDILILIEGNNIEEYIINLFY